jgi:hypothetical protein
MKQKDHSKLTGVWIVGIYNILLGILLLSVIPSTMIMSQRFENAMSCLLSPLTWGLLPIVILSIFYIISAVAIMRAKEWGRICILIASGTQCVMGLHTIISSFKHGYQGPMSFSYIVVLFGLWAIYYLNRAVVKDWFSASKKS